MVFFCEMVSGKYDTDRNVSLYVWIDVDLNLRWAAGMYMRDSFVEGVRDVPFS